MPGPKETKCSAVVTLDKFTLAVVDHMLDHLRLKARVVAAALLHLAVDDPVKGNLALDVARGLGDLLVRQAALLHLAGTQAKHQTGVVEHMGLAGVVQIDADLLGDADLVGGKAAGICLLYTSPSPRDA